MRIFVGGFGFQGLASVPFLNVIERLGQLDSVVCTGISCVYAAVLKRFGREKALERLKCFLERFEEELLAFDRIWTRVNRKGWKYKAIRYCTLLSEKDHTRDWQEVEDILEGLDISSQMKAEVFDVEEIEVSLIGTTLREVAMAGVAFPGLFPPYKGKYLASSYLSQIPVSFVKDGDVIFYNFRDVEKYPPSCADEILAHSAEIRSISYAKKVLDEFSVVLIRSFDVDPVNLDWKELLEKEDDFARDLEEVILA